MLTRILFEKVEQLMGITFSQDALRDLHNACFCFYFYFILFHFIYILFPSYFYLQFLQNPEDFDFVDSDIGDIHPKIKHMNIVDYAEGYNSSPSSSLLSLISD